MITIMTKKITTMKDTITKKLIERLSSLGLRKTKARLAVIQELAQSAKPLSAPELSSRLSSFDRVTIYRELATLTESGLISEAWLGRKAVSYYLNDEGHKHLAVCISCGKVTSIPMPETSDCKEDYVSRKTGYKIARHSTEYFGYCKNCC